MTHIPHTRFTNLAMASALSAVLVVSLAACNKTPEMGSAAPPSITVGTEIDDTVITTRVKSALMADSAISSTDFKVETRKGEVMLSGFVNNQQQMDRALKLAAQTEGVRNVSNEMKLKE